MLQLAGAIAAEILTAFLVDYFFLFLCLVVVLLARIHYRKYSELQEGVYGSPRFGLKEVIERLILTGLVAGFASSFLVVTAG